jgi:hypothetical protein
MNKEKISLKDETQRAFSWGEWKKALEQFQGWVSILFKRLGMIRRVFSQKVWTKEGVV